ncbi:hypothetical protein BOTNAR_0396g00090 [Botryotinia narcissicola]|uniref:Uncharacterized protein n=1 Tax=Botryotinia narcissicola TaxID=278944 RepID=A0A4Z1HNG8_9HELO|nr:hypothetical protein BOTNAR_0396g00090 [Botryotinia narcissicola]
MTTDSNIDIDPLNLLDLADYISLALTLLTLLLLTLIPRWKTDRNPDTASERQVKAFPSRTLSITLGLISGFAFLFAFTSILWQHLAAVTASRMAGSIDVMVCVYGVFTHGVEFEESEENFWVM